MMRDSWRREQRGWPARFPVAQFPNAPLWVALVGRAIAVMTDGSVHAYARAAFYAGLAAWAMGRTGQRPELGASRTRGRWPYLRGEQGRRGTPSVSGSLVERVWDYPRPPAVTVCRRRIRVELAGEALADSTRALRVLETSHPPTVYVPPDDVRGDLLAPSGAPSTWCEFKGAARYLDAVVAGRRVHAVAWTYRDPTPGYEALRDHVAFYPAAWMSHGWATSGCRRKRATSTVAGSPPTSSDRSKDHRKRLVGEPSRAKLLVERATAADLPTCSCGRARTRVSATSLPHCARSANATSASAAALPARRPLRRTGGSPPSSRGCCPEERSAAAGHCSSSGPGGAVASDHGQYDRVGRRRRAWTTSQFRNRSLSVEAIWLERFPVRLPRADRITAQAPEGIHRKHRYTERDAATLGRPAGRCDSLRLQGAARTCGLPDGVGGIAETATTRMSARCSSRFGESDDAPVRPGPPDAAPTSCVMHSVHAPERVAVSSRLSGASGDARTADDSLGDKPKEARARLVGGQPARRRDPWVARAPATVADRRSPPARSRRACAGRCWC